MNKIIILLPLLTLLFVGCIEEAQFNLIQSHDYQLGGTLDGIHFNIPPNINREKPIFIRFTPSLPNGSSYGTYSRLFRPCPETCFVSAKGSVYLYYPGLWHVDYEILEDNVKKIDGTYNFWVQSETQTLARYEHTYTLTKTPASLEIDFAVQNTGRANGIVSIVIYDDGPAHINNMTFYGKEYFTRDVYLKTGHYYTDSIRIPSVHKNLKIRLNGEIHEIN